MNSNNSLEAFSHYKSALVLIPHPDDEIIGCGGILSYMNEIGIDINFLYITSGENGLKRNMRDKNPYIREKEAALALTELGICDPIMDFLRVEDGNISSNLILVKDYIDRILFNNKIDLVFVPSYYEEHPDHFSIAEALSYTKSGSEIMIAMYEVWSPLRPNCLFSINNYYEYKIRALKRYQTQNYLRICDMAKSLAEYRGCRKLGIRKQHCEAFYLCNQEEFKRNIAMYRCYMRNLIMHEKMEGKSVY